MKTKQWMVSVYENGKPRFTKPFYRKGKAVAYALYWDNHPDRKWRSVVRKIDVTPQEKI